jgi:hypothetical protein
MRRDQRQTGSTRVAKPSKMDSVHPPASAGFKPGPYARDRYLQEIKAPTGRMLRRSFGANLRPDSRKT